jgi:hypothetical protein
MTAKLNFDGKICGGGRFFGGGGGPYGGSSLTCTHRIVANVPGEGALLSPSPNGAFALRAKFSDIPSWRSGRRFRQTSRRSVFKTGAFLRLGYWLILRKISPNYVLPSPGSERREVTTISAKPTALFAAVWSRSSPLVVVIMNRGVANVLNNTYRLISRLPMVKRNSIRN